MRFVEPRFRAAISNPRSTLELALEIERRPGIKSPMQSRDCRDAWLGGVQKEPLFIAEGVAAALSERFFATKMRGLKRYGR